MNEFTSHYYCAVFQISNLSYFVITVDVVTDLKRKEEELNEIKQFSEDQTSELTKLKKDLHKVERDSKYALEKSESDAKRELNSATAKIEDLQVHHFKKC